jgi:DivIVA domain-containing protein
MPPDSVPVELPDQRPATPADIERLRLPVVLRGYRMHEVDWVLDRLAGELDQRDTELRRRDAEIARLRAELDRGYASPNGAVPVEVDGSPGDLADSDRVGTDAVEADAVEVDAVEVDAVEVRPVDDEVTGEVAEDDPGIRSARAPE